MPNQKGGSSDFMHAFYSATALGGPAAISAATLQGINAAPMFNPLSALAVIPTMSTGIVPTAMYLAQLGGSQGSEVDTVQLRDACNKNGISCRGKNGNFLQNSTLFKKLRSLLNPGQKGKKGQKGQKGGGFFGITLPTVSTGAATKQQCLDCYKTGHTGSRCSKKLIDECDARGLRRAGASGVSYNFI
jgi:hypothetical protein